MIFIALPFIIAVVHGLMWLLTSGVQYVSSELFQKPLPFWPVYVCILLVNAIIITPLSNRGKK